MIACIVSGPGAPDEVKKRAEEIFAQHGVECWHATRDHAETSIASRLAKTDVLMTLGGDGTFLAGARLAGPRGIPLLGENDVPPLLADAVVATEDERFYSHHGIDSIGLSRALLYDLTNLCLCQGGSTITAQLAKDVYLG